MQHDANDLIVLFNHSFKAAENTVLIGGYEEPLYLPADKEHPHHRVIFTRDYFASALHEIAHWCIAGDVRRLQVDYGYWYFPEGRNHQQQMQFEAAEVKPQALECIFSMAAKSRFTVSQDNLSQQEACIASTFAEKVADQVMLYLTCGMPARANLFRDQLLQFYQPDHCHTGLEELSV